jgi:hypothetical protein
VATGSLNVALGGYADRVRFDGPAGYWRLGDALGSGTAADSSGNGLTGAVTGGVTFGEPGALADGDTAARFDGTGYIDMGHPASLSAVANVFTLEFWFTPDDITTTLHGVVSKRADAGPYEYSVHCDVAGTFSFMTYTSSGAGVYGGFGGQAAIPDTNKHHWIFTADGTNAYVYRDGVQVATVAKTANNMSATAAPFRIGQGGGSGAPRWAKGVVDEVAFRQTYTTAAQAAEHYALRTAGPTLVGAGTVAVSGSLDSALGTLTLDGDADVNVSGSMSAELGTLIGAATGAVGVSGSAAPTLGSLTAAGTGTVAVSGSASPTLGAVTAAGTGTVDVAGSADATLGAVTLSATGIIITISSERTAVVAAESRASIVSLENRTAVVPSTE